MCEFSQEDLIRLITEAREAGVASADIAEVANLSPSQLYRFCKKHGIPLGTAGKKDYTIADLGYVDQETRSELFENVRQGDLAIDELTEEVLRHVLLTGSKRHREIMLNKIRDDVLGDYARYELMNAHRPHEDREIRRLRRTIQEDGVSILEKVKAVLRGRCCVEGAYRLDGERATLEELIAEADADLTSLGLPTISKKATQ